MPNSRWSHSLILYSAKCITPLGPNLFWKLCSSSSLVEGDEGLYWPNCQTNLVIVPHELLFYNFINTTALSSNTNLHLLLLRDHCQARSKGHSGGIPKMKWLRL